MLFNILIKNTWNYRTPKKNWIAFLDSAHALLQNDV